MHWICQLLKSKDKVVLLFQDNDFKRPLSIINVILEKKNLTKETDNDIKMTCDREILKLSLKYEARSC